jgi:hypothetical protein
VKAGRLATAEVKVDAVDSSRGDEDEASFGDLGHRTRFAVVSDLDGDSQFG